VPFNLFDNEGEEKSSLGLPIYDIKCWSMIFIKHEDESNNEDFFID